MTWFTTFTILLAVQFGISDDILAGYEGNRLHLIIHNTEKIQKCEIETNIGDKYEFMPDQYRPITDYMYARNTLSCTVQIYALRLKDVGEWKITSYFQKDNYPPVTNKFKIYLKQDVKVIPTSITISEGYFMYAKLDVDTKNVTSCILNQCAGCIDSNRIEQDLLNVRTENLQRFGQCGFRALANESGSWRWELKAIVEEVMYVGYVDVTVDRNMETPEKVPTIITLNLGKRDQVSLHIDSSITFCQLEDPMGVKTPVSYSCVRDIPVVTTRHQGVWIARYGVKGNPVPIVRRFKVVTRDLTSTDCNATVTRDNEIQLLCHIYDEAKISLDFCYFTRPDGYMLNMNPGIGTSSYSSFNVSKFRNENIYCGLIIHEPKQHDYGGWKCNIGGVLRNVIEYFHGGSIIYVDPDIMNINGTQNTSRNVHIVTENVYVKQNDSFQIKCTADAVLSYCWFRSPNGTFYSVTPNQDQSPTNLPYVGLGLNFGECMAQIDHASDTDDGIWICNVGVADGPEESKMFLVNVAESYVIPERSEILIDYYEDNTTLSCNILPSITDKEVRYCRWVRPDGHGIHNSLSHRYTTNRSNTQCRLIIANIYENIGRWTCVVGLYGFESEEAWATINVHTGLTATLLLTGVLRVLSFIHIRKKRLTPLKQSPPYNFTNNMAQYFVKA